MSSGLMSCVRENSPPLELDVSAAGPLSLPEGTSRTHGYQGPMTSTPISSPAAAEGATADGHCSTNVGESHFLEHHCAYIYSKYKSTRVRVCLCVCIYAGAGVIYLCVLIRITMFAKIVRDFPERQQCAAIVYTLCVEGSFELMGILSWP